MTAVEVISCGERWPITGSERFTIGRTADLSVDDNQVCQKLAKAGVPGLHGGPGNLAANRRARLVEFSLSTGLVSEADLRDLDLPHRLDC